MRPCTERGEELPDQEWKNIFGLNLGAQTQNDSNECSQELTKHVEAGMFLAPIWP